MCHVDGFGTMSDVQLGPVPPTRLRDTPRRGPVGWVAVVACAQLVVRSHVQDRYLVDFRALHDRAVRFWHGVSVYADPRFLLTPACCS
jgi:hypothetical protein